MDEEKCTQEEKFQLKPRDHPVCTIFRPCLFSTGKMYSIRCRVCLGHRTRETVFLAAFSRTSTAVEMAAVRSGVDRVSTVSIQKPR